MRLRAIIMAGIVGIVTTVAQWVQLWTLLLSEDRPQLYWYAAVAEEHRQGAPYHQ
jgi:hypothetical protein